MKALLRSIRELEEAGRPPYLSELSDRLRGSFPVEASQILQILERYGYVIVDRANGVVGVSRDGHLVAAGDKVQDLAGDLLHHYESAVVPSDRAVPRGHDLLEGRYRRFGALGSGAISTAYRGETISTGREVAIKELREIFAYFTPLQKVEIVRRLERVVAEHARISHPNVLQVFDQSVASGFPFFVTELAHGGSLRRLVARQDPVPPSIVVAYFVQICHGLKTAHSLGIVHRGLKPENVLFDVHGNAKLGDFGLSTVVDRGPGQAGHVFVGMGSVGYMAPEQFQDPRAADSRTDIYSLGILFYELCTGRLPGRRSPMPSTVRDDLPKGLDDIFDRMTQDDPDDRYPLVEAILDDLYRVDGAVALLDKRAAVLMHRGVFAELDLPPIEESEAPAPEVEAGSSEMRQILPSAPVHAQAAEGETLGQGSHVAPGVGVPAATRPSVPPERLEESSPVRPSEPPTPMARTDASEDYYLGYRSVDEGVEQPADGGAEVPAEHAERPSEPVMPRRRFGVPPRRK